MQALRNDGAGGRGIQYVPKSGEYQNVVVWLHGLGDTADGWASMMPELRLENTKFILPTAKSRPIALNGGSPMPGWSDIYGLSSSDREDRAGFDESAARVNTLLQQEIDKGVAPARIVVAGFSQGGALAFHTALRSAHTLGGIVALSTWVPLRDDYPASFSSAMSTVPILQVHGDEDRVVGHKWGKGSHELLKTLSIKPEPQFITIEGMGHSSDPEEMEHV
eukprot:gene30342-34250_t